MDIFTLLIARSLRHPFAVSLDGTEEQQVQAEPELPAIDFALLSKVTRDDQQANRSRETFAGRPVTATM
jgi:hypothetical protein